MITPKVCDAPVTKPLASPLGVYFSRSAAATMRSSLLDPTPVFLGQQPSAEPSPVGEEDGGPSVNGLSELA